jgi:hypothetical protein
MPSFDCKRGMPKSLAVLFLAASALSPLFAASGVSPAAPVVLSKTALAESYSVSPGVKGFVLSPDLKTKDFYASVKTLMNLSPDKVTAHHDAARFPGAVPANAPHVSRTMEFSTGVPRWQSTGLYAAPGEVVTIKLDAPLPQGAKLRVRVGCHTDELDEAGHWPLKRFPMLSREFTVAPGVTQIANAFGGNIFVEVSGTEMTTVTPYMWQGWEKARPKSSTLAQVGAVPFKLAFANAVEAPCFRLGDDSPAAWEKIRTAPGPWAELIGKNVVLHVPSSEVRELKDPAALLEWWDKVVATEDWLVGWPTRTYRERMVPDIQISGGWMHAGYPFMYHLQSSKNSHDLAKLTKEGDWGFFHELGHNHQSPDWTFDGQVETTVNFFSLYCMENIVGLPRGQGHESMKDLGKILDKRLGTPANKGAFEQLAPFVALTRKYDWAPLRATLASYQSKPNPREFTEKQRQAEFVARYSEFAKADLSVFFARLGYDVTGVAARVKGLPAFDYEAFRASLDSTKVAAAK